MQTPLKLVRVWDLPVRVFHWSLVLLVLCSWVSAENGLLRVHLWSGLALLTLLVFRIIWGFVGSSTARFSQFVRSPRQALEYLRATKRGEGQLHAGHNPAGGWMVLALLTVLSLQAMTGLFSNDGIRFFGPLAARISAALSDRLTTLHGTIFNVILTFVWLHIVAVLYYRYVRAENLVAPMINGSKPDAMLPAGPPPKLVAVRWALLCLVFAVLLVWWILKP